MSRKATVFPSISYGFGSNIWSIDKLTGIWGSIDIGNHIEKLYGACEINEKRMSEYIDVVCCNRKLFFVPGKMEIPSVTVFDLENETQKKLELNKYIIRDARKDNFYFSMGVAYGKYVFMIADSYPAIIRIDSETDEIVYLRKTICRLDERNVGSLQGYFSVTQIELINHTLIVPCSMEKGVLKINLVTLEEGFVLFDTIRSEGLSAILNIDNELFWVACCGAEANWLYQINLSVNKVIQEVPLKNPPKEFPVKKMLVSSSGDIYIFPNDNWTPVPLDIYKLDSKTFELINLDILAKDFKSEPYIWGNEIIYAGWKDKDTILFVTGRDMLWHEYNIQKKMVLDYEMSIDTKDSKYDYVIRNYLDNRRKMRIPEYENQIGIDKFCNYLLSM